MLDAAEHAADAGGVVGKKAEKAAAKAARESREAAADAARLVNPTKANSPVWHEARPLKGELRRLGDEIWAWDKPHNDTEVYDKRGRHLGSRNPVTGELYKPAVRGRWLDL